MIDLTGKLEVFIITNGRSSFDFVHRALLDQNCEFKITVIRDMKWVDALNECVKLCSCSHYLRCDDDHLLHPCAVSFMYQGFIKKPRSALFTCGLWEDWSGRVGGGTKMYNKKIVAALGGFKANHLGKVDKVFRKKIDSSSYGLSGSKKSVVGIHACSPADEQIRYEKLWSKLADKPYVKTTRKRMHKYKVSLPDQFKMSRKFIRKLNKKQSSPFYEYIMSNERNASE